MVKEPNLPYYIAQAGGRTEAPMSSLKAQRETQKAPIFKWSTSDLNSEFSFSNIGCHGKDKKPSLFCYFSMKWNKNSII